MTGERALGIVANAAAATVALLIISGFAQAFAVSPHGHPAQVVQVVVQELANPVVAIFAVAAVAAAAVEGNDRGVRAVIWTGSIGAAVIAVAAVLQCLQAVGVPVFASAHSPYSRVTFGNGWARLAVGTPPAGALVLSLAALAIARAVLSEVVDE